MKLMKNKALALFTAVVLAVTGMAGFAGCNPTTGVGGTTGGNTTGGSTGGEDDGGADADIAEPSAVTNLKAKAGNTEVTLTWTNPKAESFTGVKVFVNDSEKTELDKTVSSYKVTGLTNDTEYTFKVRALFEGSDKTFDATVKKTPSATPVVSSVEFAQNLTIGWNLGNAFDASGSNDWAYSQAEKMEYSWLPHGASSKTTQNLIKAVKAAGFDTIRIPVSWHNQMGGRDTTTYTITDTWMNRVKEVVDWAIDEDMYVIINIHHDNLTEAEMAAGNPGFAISTNETYQTKSKNYIEKVWQQIAAKFKDYDEHLIFEVLNEPRCVGTDYEWSISGSSATTYCNIITAYEQVGLDAIRESGGNNATRYVMVPGYAASPSFLDSYTMPVDTADDKLILSTHAYTPGDFALKGSKTDYDTNKTYIETSINGVFNDLKRDYINNGIGVIMGEASASDKENTASREKWATYYFTKAKATGIPVVLWDNEVVVAELSTENKAKFDEGDNGENHGYFNRKTCTQYFSTVVTAMMTAVNAPVDESLNVDYGLLDGALDLSDSKWSIHASLSASKFSSATTSSKLVFTCEKATDYSGSTGQIKIQEEWAATHVLEKVIEGTIPGKLTYTPTAAEWAAIKEKGLIVYGYGPKITKLELQ